MLLCMLCMLLCMILCTLLARVALLLARVAAWRHSRAGSLLDARSLCFSCFCSLRDSQAGNCLDLLADR
jgi:hypothetical protein